MSAGAPPLAKLIRMQYTFAHNVFKQNVAGFEADDSLRTPEPGGNNLNWIGGHVVSARISALRLLGVEPMWSDEEMARYARGSDPVLTPEEAMPWDRILRDLDRTQELLLSRLETVTPETLAAALPADANPFQLDSVGEMLFTFTFHEAYHVGQLGLLRRVLGKDGAIQ